MRKLGEDAIRDLPGGYYQESIVRKHSCLEAGQQQPNQQNLGFYMLLCGSFKQLTKRLETKKFSFYLLGLCGE